MLLTGIGRSFLFLIIASTSVVFLTLG